jgi:uncharacterized YccA/Bax inhibitor family protein
MYDAPAYTPVHERVMTVDAVVTRTAAMLAVVFATGAATWLALPERYYAVAVLGAAIVGLALGLVIAFRQLTNPALILTYAAVEGVVLGAVTRVFEARYPGIAVQAVVGTAAVFGSMVFAYRMRWLRATPMFTRVVMGALIGVVVLMLANLVVGLVGHGDGLGLRSGGTVGIIFSLVCIVVAALTFILDFDQVERGIAARLPERYAWYAAFGIVMGLIWLYLEILRLLGNLRR